MAQLSMRPANGSRLSCGRPVRRRRGRGRTSRARQGTTQRLPYRTKAPGSFKRMLGAAHPIELGIARSALQCCEGG